MFLSGLEFLFVPKQQICISWRSKEKCFWHHLLACLIKAEDRRKQTAADSPLCNRSDILLSFQKYICDWNKKGSIGAKAEEKKIRHWIIPSQHHRKSQKNGHITEIINLVLDSYGAAWLTLTALSCHWSGAGEEAGFQERTADVEENIMLKDRKSFFRKSQLPKLKALCVQPRVNFSHNLPH